MRRGTAALSVTALVTGTVLGTAGTASAVDVGSQVVISEVYGGGGNSGAPFTNDFIELYNKGATAVDLSAWSVQYASANGTSYATTALTGSIAAGAHYLIQEAAGAAAPAPLPTPDVVGTIAMSGTTAKVALVSSATALACGADCDAATGVVDFVGYGTASDFAGAVGPATSNSTSIARNAAGDNTGNNGADFSAGGPTPKAAPIVVQPPTDAGDRTIEQIQGAGDSSPIAGQRATTRGVVTAKYATGGFNGYYIQTPGTGGAIDLAGRTTSDALFVYSPSTVAGVTVGGYVEVTGLVAEYAGATQINVAAPADVTVLTDTVVAPTAATTRAFPTLAQRESLEGMLYSVKAPFTITNNYSTNQYGELGLALGDTPLLQPTEVARPGSPEYAAQVAKNAENSVVLDDGASTNFLSAAASAQTPPYLADPTKATQIAPRVGAAVTFSKTVVLTQGGSPTTPTWRFEPTSQVTPAAVGNYPASWTDTRLSNAEPDANLIGPADVEVASFNVLNYFTTLGGDLPASAKCTAYNDRDGHPITVKSCNGIPNGPRGAWDSASFQRQQAKIVKAINGLGAGVVGLMEIENSLVVDGAKDEAVGALVAALNADAGAGTWAFVPSSTELPAATSMDVITNAIIYRPAAVTRDGASRALGTASGSGQAFDNAREPIAQKFVPVGGGDPFTFVVNHFKSKGSGSGADADQGDGQGASNASRVRQAGALRDWIGTIADPTTDPVVMVGDYNSYRQEDPLQVLYAAGYADAEQAFQVNKWSYSFSGLSGSLDHVLLNSAARARATGADIWNINSPESVAVQYSRYNSHGTLFYAADKFGASDHDPVVLGLSKVAQPAGATKLTLLNINDFHGRINNNTVRFAGTVERLRSVAGDDNTALLSAGDNVGASLFASAFEQDKPTIDVLNALQLRASAVGNHEFDKGFADLTDRIMAPESPDNPRGGADWAYLGANVYRKGTTTPALPEYKILTIDGKRVGVIGAVTQETPSLVTPAGIASLDFGDPVDAVNRVAAQLTDGNPANGEADVLIAEYHEGAGAGTPDQATLEQEIAAGGAFAKIATKTSAKVAAIFTGHTHKEYAWDGPIPGTPAGTRPILQTGAYGERVGEVTLTVNADNSIAAHTARNVPRSSAPESLLVAGDTDVAAVKAIVDDVLPRANVAGSVPVGSVAADITTAYSGGDYTGNGGTYAGGSRDDRSKESALGDLVADALVESMADPNRGGAEIGVVNPGGLRADLFATPDPTITTAEANAVLPFVNNLNTVSLTGAQFKTLLEQQWQTNPDGSVPSRPYLGLGLSKNVTWTYDATAAQGAHVTSISVAGKPIDPAASYRIGTFSFLITGGDNFRIFTQGADPRDSGLIDRDAWITFLGNNKGLVPDFARQGASLPQLPTEVEAGGSLAFTVGGLNLTSLGAPKNTSVQVAIDDTDLGGFPVSTTIDAGDARGVLNGRAAVSATVPAGVTAGAHTLTVAAVPSGTTVTVPITVGSAQADPVVSKTYLTASAPKQVYGVAVPVTLTATAELQDGTAPAGAVVFRSGTTVLATVPVAADGTATYAVSRSAAVGKYSFTAEFVPTDSTVQLGSTSDPVAFKVTKALSKTTVTAKLVALTAAQQKVTRLKSGIVVTATVTMVNSAAPADGVVNVNVNGVKRASVTVRGGRATTGMIPVPKGATWVIATYAPLSATSVERSTGRVRVTVPR